MAGGGLGEERPQPAVGVVTEVRRHGRVGVEAVDIDGDAPVLAERDPGDAHQRLGDHPLGRRATGQGGDRREVVLAQGEGGGVVDRAMGQAADAGGGAGPQDAAPCPGRLASLVWIHATNLLSPGFTARSTPRHSPRTGRTTTTRWLADTLVDKSSARADR